MFEWQSERRTVLAVTALFLAIYFMPVGAARFDGAILEGLSLVAWYAREHVILCLLPAFLIAGAVAVFVSQGAVLRHLGPAANKAVAYGVASISGTLLAVCSCTVLPLFGAIYRRGAGLGPAVAFLYAGPAINVLAIVVTARVLGFELGVARAVGAVTFAVLIGVIMHLLFLREERGRAAPRNGLGEANGGAPPVDAALVLGGLVVVLVFANWGPGGGEAWAWIHALKWPLTALSGAAVLGVLVIRRGWSVRPVLALAVVILGASLVAPAHPELAFALGTVGLAILALRQGEEGEEWVAQSWDFAKRILPLLLAGVFVAGVLLGRPGAEGLIPSQWVAAWVGGNSLPANLFASVVGALMYFATLTEVAIVQALLGAGMGKGPALALLLAGPALSLPNMLVIRSILGARRTAAYIVLVVVMATASGMIYGHLFA